MAAEKNIAALLREDAKTVRVMFGDFDSLGRLKGQFDHNIDPVIGEIAAKSIEQYQEYNAAGRGGYKFYSYVTHLDVQSGDLVLVEAAGQLKVAQVMEVDQEVRVEPGSQFALRWVLSKIDLSEHSANMVKNEEIENLVNQAYKANLRRSFQQQILGGMDESAAGNLQKLLGGQ